VLRIGPGLIASLAPSKAQMHDYGILVFCCVEKLRQQKRLIMTTTTNDNTSPTPHRLRQPETTIDIIRERIRTGFYGVGDRIAGQRELTEELHVHRRVIRAAMTQLEREGLILCHPNSRPIVQSVPAVRATSVPALSNLVALVIHQDGPSEREGSGEQRILWGMSQELRRAGYHAVFLDLSYDKDLKDAEIDAMHLEYALDREFGGIVFYSYSGDENRDLIRKVARQMPLILIDRMPLGIDSDYVGIKNYEIMFDAARYLIEQGHRRIAYVTTARPVNTVQTRLCGYMAAISEYENEVLNDMVVVTSAAGTTWPVFDCLFRLPVEERPTAVLCVNDYEAVRVAERLSYLGLAVPHDVSIIGCDNLVPILPGGISLTTIVQPFVEIGKEAARLFLRRKAEPESLPLSVEVPTELIVRGSTRSTRPNEALHAK